MSNQTFTIKYEVSDSDLKENNENLTGAAHSYLRCLKSKGLSVNNVPIDVLEIKIEENEEKYTCQTCGEALKLFMIDDGTNLDQVYGCPDCDS